MTDRRTDGCTNILITNATLNCVVRPKLVCEGSTNLCAAINCSSPGQKSMSNRSSFIRLWYTAVKKWHEYLTWSFQVMGNFLIEKTKIALKDKGDGQMSPKCNHFYRI